MKTIVLELDKDEACAIGAVLSKINIDAVMGLYPEMTKEQAGYMAPFLLTAYMQLCEKLEGM